jgi:signal transduction histidine kinase
MVSDIFSRENKVNLNNKKKRVILVNFVIPLNLIIGLMIIFIQMLYLERDINKDDLKTKKFLHKPLIEILENRDNFTNPPDWLLFVAMDSGEIIYLVEEASFSQLPLKNQIGKYKLDLMLADIVKKLPDTITLVPFKYKGQNGLAIYMHDLLPLFMQVLQKPAYIGFIFFLTMSMFLMGLLQMNSFFRSVRRLIQASVRIAHKDLDTEIHSEQELELARVFQAFEQMRKALKSNRDKEARFVMSVTHDLKTPLAAMRMYLEAMKDGYIEIGDEAEKAVSKILVKSGILEDRIGELLEYSKLQTSVHELKRDIIDVKTWISEQNVYFDDECQMNDRKYSNEISLPPDLKILVNSKLVNRALNNLIDNACRYTKKGDSIKLRAYYEGDYLILNLEDSGPGVETTEREKIFELFYRADKGRNSRGMGIGLASVQYIIENHGGAISCGESSLGGSSFTVSLPIHKL